MAYRLSRSESIHQAAVRIADEELGEAIARLREGQASDAHDRVHAARKAIKRTRALLRLLRDGLGAGFHRDNLDLRDAARRLAERRDAAVAADVFASLVPAPEGALAAVGDRLAAVRDQVVASEEALLAAADDLARVRNRSADWPAPARGWSVLEPGLKTSYEQGRRAMRNAFADPTPAAFHAWRKRVKDLWYHTQLLHNVWKCVQAAWADSLEQLSDALGEDHDLEVLRVALGQHPDLDAEARRDVLARADARSAELRARAWSLGQRLYAERPRRYVARIGDYWEVWRDGERPSAEPRPCGTTVAPATSLSPDPEVICPGDLVAEDLAERKDEHA
ncbi:CHAD domain-containing protein [Nannocystis exedens]|uniref:CHAD domain-containing protein n=1 Tax=Nannocystis exedens TaxID=54 RepID=A0A1I1XMI5_9BACT|nr:CHAD domain-containing protein [Nannocystis exedens]PCC73310.1 CHAD domain protein [Nannocystis exedens]SFE08624.1 CHAD domain-containing protein [Nannocystis exedens]